MQTLMWIFQKGKVEKGVGVAYCLPHMASNLGALIPR
jgi:hypothetical protein